MRILRLANFKIQPAVASLHKNKNKYYFNLRHGTKGTHFWRWSMGLDYRHFKPVKSDTEYVLDNDNYIIEPIKRNGNILEDKAGNVMYNISVDTMSTHKKDILLLWDIPNKNFINVTYSIKGMCSVIGEGSVGRVRSEQAYKSPSPVIEILGDSILYWSGVGADGKKYSQTIKYDYAEKNWDVSPINIG